MARCCNDSAGEPNAVLIQRKAMRPRAPMLDEGAKGALGMTQSGSRDLHHCPMRDRPLPFGWLILCETQPSLDDVGDRWR